MSININKCALCGEEKKLIEAHIIPKWAFNFLYPDNDPDHSKALIEINERGTKRYRIGPYDNSLLCESCDWFLGKYDDYAKTILLDKPFLIYGESDLAYFFQEVDIKKLTIFLLSVFWRGSITKNNFFDQVKLGPYEEKIKTILLEALTKATIPELSNYNFIISKFDKGKTPGLVSEMNVQKPARSRTDDGVNVYFLYFPRGIKIFFKFDKRPFPEMLRKLAAGVTPGPIIILRMGDYSESSEYAALIKTSRSLSVLKQKITWNLN